MEQRIIGANAPRVEDMIDDETGKALAEIIYNEMGEEDTDGVILTAGEPEGPNAVTEG
ncbi:MAG: hypothetical protein LUE10_09565 [Alistipes sp.]|nr:hypothetical protein [Alistipes sp.]